MPTPAALCRRKSIPLDQKIALSLDDAEALTGLCKRTIQKMIAKGALRSSKVGARVLIDPADLKAAIFGDSTPAA